MLRLRATVDGERLLLDFAGSAPQHEGNLNCPLAVTRSACLFAVRVLTDPDIPPSAGAYRPVEVRAPRGSLLNARSRRRRGRRQRRDLLAGRRPGASRLRARARSGDDEQPHARRRLRDRPATPGAPARPFSYYETLGGGQGACADADGPSGVHVAMSNTLNTPIEALEREFPLRVIEYALRRGSGGAGRHRGGDGVVRELEALAEMTFSLIAERRRHPPRAPRADEPGASGRDLLDGAPLPGKVTGILRRGQRLRIETPGGGGFGDRH